MMTKPDINAENSVVKEYLNKPYTRQLVPEEDGTFRTEILEFPGCIATGETREEAIVKIENVAASWLESALSRGQSIPAPIDNHDFSGKIVVRFPRSLHKRASHLAEMDGVSLNQLIVTSVAQYVGSYSAPKENSSVFINSYHFTQIQNIQLGFQRLQSFSSVEGIQYGSALLSVGSEV